ncbi:MULTISPECIES: SirB2 family protein [Alishewanella]|uniref:Invasion gene expression up-regulator, SirB n=2 Tax=Alishewanella TaxID=111142 RepID=H3ZHC2_9ALTE|nr:MULTISPECIES: SirB2 family protein [Alishewanella]EHR40030.1 invasion gene expression up-regulator, SirB [Alishewanella jeotgali KCTC 22429]EJI86265.1 invasion transcriptional regulator, SirB [Alishewanella aestuarii B11]MCT8126866.1 SirB2 family protein [Alishewanella sp. BS5-314]OCW98474.1 invasion protein [Alishewanella sp. HH-ZS]
MYMAFKHLHLLLVALSVALLCLRFALRVRESGLLQQKFLKIAPHVVDTFLLLSAVALMFTIQQYPFVDAWLTEKVLALLAYIALGYSALKGRTAAIRWLSFLGALGWLGLMVRVALSKTPLFLPL